MTVDYSKIDFTKCKLEPLSDLPVDVTSTKIAVSICSAETGVAMLRKERDSAWCTNQGALYLGREWVNDLFDRGDTVDAFIATETARIEAEEEEKNWVPVPWMDVMFLSENGTSVSVDFGNGDLVDWNRKLEDGTRVYRKDALPGDRVRYFADKRTFPVGYDPPRFRRVEVDCYDAKRLNDLGASVRVGSLKCSPDSPLRRGSQTFSFHRYDVDMHTLPPGVPLHEESKPEPRPCTKEFALRHPNESEFRYWAVGADEKCSLSDWARVSGGPLARYGDEFRTTAKDEPKYAGRPCSKDFALAHFSESEARFFDDTYSKWRPWRGLHMFAFDAPPDRYEFRTTAKEDPTLDLGPFPDVTIDANEEVSQALAIHLLKSRRIAIVDLETGERFMVTPGPMDVDPGNVSSPKTKTMTCLEFAKSLVESNQEKYILVNGKCYGYRFNREHCRIETGIATDHGTVDWGPSFGLGAASDVITVTE